MVFDHVIIGSGLTALATALGLGKAHSVCVVAGRNNAEVQYYPQSSVPFTHEGWGGLGNFWHGVIPVGMPVNSLPVDAVSFADLFNYFYPGEAASGFSDQEALFVPRSPIRPLSHWTPLIAGFKRASRIGPGLVQSISQKAQHWQVNLKDLAEPIVGKHVWLAAGAVGTPAVLSRSPELQGWEKATASDHFILSLGLIDRKLHPAIASPPVRRSRHGAWFLRDPYFPRDGLVTLRPARFAYRHLDKNVAERHLFGLPAGGILKKLAKAPSAALVSEALFNKYGLFAKARFMNAYAQVRVADAFDLNSSTSTLSMRAAVVRQALVAARLRLSFPELMPSRYPELFSHGIHLHGTIDCGFAQSMEDNGLHVVDASAVDNIGHTHHSFKMMAIAHARARQFV